MRNHIVVLASLILATFATGCGGNRGPVTYEAWRADHPYAKRTGEIPGQNPGDLAIIEYTDIALRVEFGHPGEEPGYGLEKRLHTLAVNEAGIVVAESLVVTGVQEGVQP